MNTISPSAPAPDKPVQRLLFMIVQGIVDDTDAVELTCSEENGTITMNLRVASEDTGKVIGKQGRTARSIRTILSAAGMKEQRRYALNIEEEVTPAWSVG